MTEAPAPAVASARKPSRRRHRWQGGSIYKRGRGFTVVYRRPDGTQAWESGFATRGAARERLGEVLGQIKDNKFSKPKDTLFKDWCASWLESKKGMRKPSTWDSFQSAINRWMVPAFGDFYVCDITRKSVIEFFNGLARKKSRWGSRPLSSRFIRNVHTILREIFDDAMDAEVTATNPAHNLKLQGGIAPVRRGAPTVEAVEKTLARMPSACGAFMLAAALTGLRRGELLGLRWQDVDLEGGVVHVRHQLQRIRKILMDEGLFQGVERIGKTGLALVSPKSESSVRSVEMPPNLVRLLARFRGREGDGAFVFRDELGNPFDPKTVYKPLYAAQKEAEVQRFTPHALRHLYGSLLHNSGAPVKHQQEKMGHASATVTLDTYTHNVSSEGRKFAALIEAQFPIVSKLLANEPSAEPVNRRLQ